MTEDRPKGGISRIWANSGNAVGFFFAHARRDYRRSSLTRYSAAINHMKYSGSTDDKKAITRLAEKFLKEEYGFTADSISVLLDSSMVLIRVNNFLCPAEQELGAEKHHIDLIQRMHQKIFEKTKGPLIEEIQTIIKCKVVSGQSSVHFETKTLLMTFFYQHERSSGHEHPASCHSDGK